MHPHLVQGKQVKCGHLIAALEECHNSGFFPRLIGSCNGIKQELTMCLRAERLERTAENREKAKQMTEQRKKIFKEIDEES